MCGRYVLKSDLGLLQHRFKFPSGETPYAANFNIAPSQNVLTVTNQGARHAQYMRWGLIPFWATDPHVGYKTINARAESLDEKPTFRNAFKKRRCLILADGFFEWSARGAEKIATYLFLKSMKPFAFAGLWETWASPEGEHIRSCTIVTTESNSLIKPLHHRMPVILSEEAEALWLDPITSDPKILKAPLLPTPSELMDCYEVSSSVNSVNNTGPDIIEEVSSI